MLQSSLSGIEGHEQVAHFGGSRMTSVAVISQGQIGTAARACAASKLTRDALPRATSLTVPTGSRHIDHRRGLAIALW